MNSLDWIKVSIANTYGNGIDKKSFDEKIHWVNSQEDWSSLISQADEPCRFQRGIYELNQAKHTGKTSYAVGLDAGASGVQVLSALMGCITGAINTGLASANPVDIYLKNYEQMGTMVELPSTIKRKDLKKALMCFFYGSIAVPKKTFEAHPHLLNIFFKACSITAPGAFELFNILMQIMEMLPTKEEFRWTMPNGFTVSTWALDKVSHQVEIEEFSKKKVHIVRKYVNRTERYRALAANVAHSTDAFVASELRGRAMWNREHLNHVYDSMVNQGIYADWNATAECSSIYKVKEWHNLGYAQKSKLMAVIQMIKDTPQYDLYTVH